MKIKSQAHITFISYTSQITSTSFTTDWQGIWCSNTHQKIKRGSYIIFLILYLIVCTRSTKFKSHAGKTNLALFTCAPWVQDRTWHTMRGSWALLNKCRVNLKKKLSDIHEISFLIQLLFRPYLIKLLKNFKNNKNVYWSKIVTFSVFLYLLICKFPS